MKILITGGAGFIGSHLAERLLSEGHDIYILDNLSTGRKENFAKIKTHVWFHNGSVCDDSLMKSLVQEVDQIYHMAAVVGVKKYLSAPVETILTNLNGAEIVLRYASEFGKKVLLASTSETYGKNSNVPFTEDMDKVIGPSTKKRWGYACSKAMDEFLAIAYHEERGLKMVIARMFNIVGPRQVSDYGMVLPTFVGQALKEEPITVYGDGQQTRSFCHVYDAVEILIRLMNHPDANGDIFNIGSSDEITMVGLAERVIQVVGDGEGAISIVSYDEAYGPGFEDMMRRCPDTSKVRDLIGYGLEYDLDMIIEDTMKWMKS